MKNKTSILFVVNPVAGTAALINFEQTVVRQLDLSKYSYEIFYTQRPKHASELNELGLLNDVDVLIAVGGDGTVNEVAKNVLHTSIALGIVPTGSGNGFARHLGISMKVEKAIKNLNSATIRKVDAAKIQEQLFLNVAGLGFDALISHQFAEYGKRGFLSYALLAMKSFASYQSESYSLDINGSVIERRAFVIAIGNSSQYGNNAYITPDAKIDDGLLDICILKDLRWYNLPLIGWQLFNKKLSNQPKAEFFKAKHLTITHKSELFHYDGEPHHTKEKIRVEVLPLAINIIC